MICKHSRYSANLFLALFILVANHSLLAQTKGSFVDSRDNHEYPTVTYDLTKVELSFSDLDEYATYLKKEKQRYEVTFERSPSTITWMAQNLNFELKESKCKYENDPDCKEHGRLYTWEAATKACPTGWHLPSDDEWFLLASLYGGVAEAGQHLKSEEISGTNSSMFNVRKPSIFWSSDELDSESALDWKVNFRWVKLQRWKGGKNLYNTVRCVRDY